MANLIFFVHILILKFSSKNPFESFIGKKCRIYLIFFKIHVQCLWNSLKCTPGFKKASNILCDFYHFIALQRVEKLYKNNVCKASSTFTNIIKFYNWVFSVIHSHFLRTRHTVTQIGNLKNISPKNR